MINIILFGPPGSGKGTQANSIAEKYNLLHISTGDLFRYEIGNSTELGQLAKSYMNKGELVPDDVTIGMLKNKVDAYPDVAGYIFDGFPRNVYQSEARSSQNSNQRLKKRPSSPSSPLSSFCTRPTAPLL